ncbi:MAG: hypothetical protein K6C69_05715 [Lachnospiraceae bacterium]|nr:hypothetical protein [Lachnospiraceae bacterium]
MNYIQEKSKSPMDIMVFTDMDSLEAYFQRGTADVLLASADFVDSHRGSLLAIKIIKLTEEPLLDAGHEDSGILVFKYQKAGEILKEISDDSFMEPEFGRRSAKNCKLFSIYSPLGRGGKTTFALGLCGALAKTHRVLYINLEEYSGLKHSLLRSNQGGLSELLYMFRRGMGGIKERLVAMVGNIGGFDYLPPVDCPEDVEDLLLEEWMNFFNYLMEQMDYDYIVVDLGTLLHKVWNFFEVMDAIFMPEPEEALEKAKLEEFHQFMRTTGHEAVLDCLHYFSLPQDAALAQGEYTYDKIEWGMVGNYVRQLVSEVAL